MGTARVRSIAALTLAMSAAGILVPSATAAAEAPHGRGSGSAVAPSGETEEILRSARDYRSWRKFTQYAEPRRSKTHSGNYVVAWYNDAAAPAVGAGAQEYPDGSVIVKENRLTAGGAPASLSVMAKRAGRWVWISATPDWQVFTWDGKPLAGDDVASCAACHGEAPKDSVYSK